MNVRAAVIPAPMREVEVRSIPVGELPAGGVWLRTLASEVCGTDVHLWHGRLSGVPYPLIPGHVSVGEVVEIAGEVHDVLGRPLRLGDVITFLDVHGTCNRCWFCLVAKATTRCPERKVYGITYGAADGLLGGWSERILLLPGVHVVPLAPQVDPDLWIAAGCGLPTALHAVDLAGIRLAESVVVLGAGPVGLAACALSAASGAGLVAAVDMAPLRLAAARGMGADCVVDAREDPVQAVSGLTGGRGADVVIEATGNPQAVALACDLARDGGRCVIVGQYTDAGDVPLNPHRQINRKHLTVQGCWGSDFSHFWRSMEVLARLRDRFAWRSSITRRYSLEEAGEALRDVEARRVVKAVIDPTRRSLAS